MALTIIVAILRALLDVIYWLLTHLVIDVIALASIALLLLIVNIEKLVKSGMFVAQFSKERIVYRKCKTCLGRTVVMLDGSPLPDHNLSVRQEGDEMIWDGRLANTKTCPSCQGLGSHWIDANDAPRRNSVNRRWYR